MLASYEHHTTKRSDFVPWSPEFVARRDDLTFARWVTISLR